MSVRARLLAAIAQQGSFTAMGGDTAANSFTLPQVSNIIFGGTPATVSGTITSVAARFTSIDSEFKVMSVFWNGTAWQVRGLSVTKITLSGVNSYGGLSVPVQAGDFMGLVGDQTNAMFLKYRDPGVGTYYRSSTSFDSVDVGDTFTVTEHTNQTYAFVGTGV